MCKVGGIDNNTKSFSPLCIILFIKIFILSYCHCVSLIKTFVISLIICKKHAKNMMNYLMFNMMKSVDGHDSLGASSLLDGLSYVLIDVSAWPLPHIFLDVVLFGQLSPK